MKKIMNEGIEKYAENFTQKGPAYLEELHEETYKQTDLPQMISGHLSGRFLKMLTHISQAKNILEIGMFTGYSALCLAEALPVDGKLLCCDISQDFAKIAQKYFNKSPYKEKISIKLAPALDTIEKINYELDLVFIDADKENYKKYYEASLAKLKEGGLIVIDNCLWSGSVLQPIEKSDQAIHDLNEYISRDERVENVILTVRDGLNIVRKK